MRSLKAQVEIQVAAHEAWEMFTNNEKLSKVDPEVISSAEFIRGNGGPGTLRLIRTGPATKDYEREALEEVENVEIGRSATYRVVAGELAERYNPYFFTVTFTPVEGKEKEQCIAEYELEYEPLSPETPPPEKSKESAIAIFNAFEAYKKHHG